MKNSDADLDDLINEPRETLDVEIKEWLDLSDTNCRASLAKEIIALANHGGGFVVVGFSDLADGTFAPAQPQPTNLKAWSQDAIHSIVAKYVDPAVQCRVVHRVSSSGDRHAIIQVPGGHRIPIRAKAGSPDGKLAALRIYIRRAGPNSEEPRTAEEWDRLLERCLQNRKTELLDAMRSIMAGEIPVAAAATVTRMDQLLAFEEQAIARWEVKVAHLPDDAPPRLVHGHYDNAFAIDGGFDEKSLAELRTIIASEVRQHSGWPPFFVLNRDPFSPQPIDGAVEFWRGPETDGSYDSPAHHDFWRISPEGFLFTRRGYNEDAGEGMERGRFLDITTPTRRIGEAIIEAGYIAQALNAADANLVSRCHWTGLAGRSLVSVGNPRRRIYQRYSAAQDDYVVTQTVAIAALPDALPEVVFAILSPLYELFDFFPLPKRLVEEELADLLGNRLHL